MPFDTLGLNWDADERTIKRAYAKLIKEFRPDSHPVEFARIREAYEKALNHERNRQYWDDEDEDDENDEADFEAEPQTQVEEPEPEPEAILPPYRRLASERLTEVVHEETPEITPYQRLPQETIIEEAIVEETLTEDALFARLEALELEANALIERIEKPFVYNPDIEDDDQDDSEDGDDFAYQPSQSAFINDMLAELDQFELPQQEALALDCFNAQLLRLDELPLDTRMDYEDALGQWLLHNKQPPLQVFAAASTQFHWDADHQNQIHQYGAAQFAKLQQFSSLYQEILDKSELPQSNVWARLRGKTHTDFLAQKDRYAQWQATCNHLNLPKLSQYFTDLPEKNFQIFAVDVFFAVSLAFLVWFVLNHHTNFEPLAMWQRALWTIGAGLVLMALAVLMRALDNYTEIQPSNKLRRTIKWLKNSPAAGLLVAFVLAILMPIFPDFVPIFGVLVLVLVLSIPMRGWYWLMAKVEAPLVNAWRLLIDALSILEKTTQGITPNPYLRFLIRPVIYMAILLPISKALLLEIWAWLLKFFKSALFKALIIFIVILAGVIYKDYTKQMQKIEMPKVQVQKN